MNGESRFESVVFFEEPPAYHVGPNSSVRDLKFRTKAFALRVISIVEKLPRDEVSRTLGRQLLRSATSVSANYRAAQRARSTPDFIYKMGLVEEEADESAHWLELLSDTGRLDSDTAQSAIRESSELIAIAIASIRTARRRLP